jgi:hypothetical protein
VFPRPLCAYGRRFKRSMTRVGERDCQDCEENPPVLFRGVRKHVAIKIRRYEIG